MEINEIILSPPERNCCVVRRYILPSAQRFGVAHTQPEARRTDLRSSRGDWTDQESPDQLLVRSRREVERKSNRCTLIVKGESLFYDGICLRTDILF